MGELTLTKGNHETYINGLNKLIEKKKEDPIKHIGEYITFFNEQRPSYSLNYLTPKQFKEFFTP